jgi:hypothetical protein
MTPNSLLEYKAMGNLAMAKIINGTGAVVWRARIFCTDTFDYDHNSFRDFDEFVDYCQHDKEINMLVRRSLANEGRIEDVSCEDVAGLGEKYMAAKTALEQTKQEIREFERRKNL